MPVILHRLPRSPVQERFAGDAMAGDGKKPIVLTIYIDTSADVRTGSDMLADAMEDMKGATLRGHDRYLRTIAAGPPPKRGAPPGPRNEEQYLPYVRRMKAKIEDGTAKSPHGAAQLVAEEWRREGGFPKNVEFNTVVWRLRRLYAEKLEK